MAELKPCPFCGSTTALCIIKENDEYVVCCDYSQGGCGATAGYRESIKAAKTIWNTRTNCGITSMNGRAENDT